MRLYLAVAVLLLALVAYTEAQEDTVERRFAEFGNQMTEMGKNLAEKAKTTLDQIRDSEFAVNSRNWFNDQFEKLKTKFGDSPQ
ncbi:apolipoprotein C-I [Dicentrarchus labrax]|uniref:Apolipoprotein C-I n=1 Tax=Dicentrarchus labrax TaxID=13489 RepID=A0A8P4K6A5_DICLA|nr:apolipoprotein C-I [Dicentrarchus labrax]